MNRKQGGIKKEISLECIIFKKGDSKSETDLSSIIENLRLSVSVFRNGMLKSPWDHFGHNLLHHQSHHNLRNFRRVN